MKMILSEVKSYGWLTSGHQIFLTIGLAIFFFLAGLGHLFNWSSTLGGAELLLGSDLSFLGAVVATGFLLIGSLLILISRWNWLGYGLLILFLIPATYLHVLVIQVAINHGLTLRGMGSPQVQNQIDQIVAIAAQGHYGNVLKNVILMVVLTAQCWKGLLFYRSK